MARMVPPVPPSGIPESERRIFLKLAQEPGTADWVVFHSLGLSSSYTGHFGEIDFVVLVPGAGIICIEAKGGGVSQRNGIWFSKDRNGVSHELKRSPFAQAQSAMFKLRKAVEEKFGKASLEAKAPLGWMVILPDVSCPPVSPDFCRGDVIDRDELDGSIASMIADCPTLRAASARRDSARFGPAPFRNLQSFFRPDFDRVLTAAASLKPVEEQLRALTEEQYAFLDTADYNDRCIVVGPAGSGKTTLALEYARRLSATGKSVLLACFNRRLGHWLADRVRSFGPGRVVAGSMHALLAKRIEQSSFAAEFRKHRDHPELFSEFYPLYGALAIDELAERFDAVVVDEAQDFRAETLAALASTWTRGVDGAKTLLFGDYSHQAIYGTPQGSLETARSLLGGPAVVPLRRNCRNTRRIAVHTSNLSGFRDLHLHESQPEGDAVDCVFYTDREDEAKRLASNITRLHAEGFSPDDVVVLGKYRIENSVVRQLPTSLPWRICDASRLSDARNTVAYSTIHSFKGLEAAVVILVDVDDLNEGEGEALLYVGMSRARLRLHMLIDASCRSDFDRKVAEGLMEAARS